MSGSIESRFDAYCQPIMAALAAVAKQVVPELLKKSPQCWWILDDTTYAGALHEAGSFRRSTPIDTGCGVSIEAMQRTLS